MGFVDKQLMAKMMGWWGVPDEDASPEICDLELASCYCKKNIYHGI